MVKLSDYFNSTTNRGRANVAKATYASFAILYIYHRLTKKAAPQPIKQTEKPVTVPEKDSSTKCPKRENQCENQPSDDCNCNKRNYCEATPGSADRNQSTYDEKSDDRGRYDERQSSVKRCETSDSNNPLQHAVPSHGGRCKQTDHKDLNSTPVKPVETVNIKAKEDVKFSSERRNFAKNKKFFLSFLPGMVKLSDYFNSTTNRGRANVAKATYASFAILYIYHRLTKKAAPQPIKQTEKTITVPEKESSTKCPKRENQCENLPIDDCNCNKRNYCEATPGLADRNQSTHDEKSDDRGRNDERQFSVTRCEAPDSNNPLQHAVPSHGGSCEQTDHKDLNSTPVKPVETVNVKAKEDVKFSNEGRFYNYSFGEPWERWE
uniref:Uncharacterized protein n=1 Tax=Glossina brevipalpis TaxID=37001 RepID=A0A1A9W030_9MUSC